MHIQLMMDRMQFRRLNKVSQPPRRFDVGMIEQFARSGEKIEPECAFERTPEQRIEDQSRKRTVGKNFDRVFIERGHCFNSARRMVNLMKDHPKALSMTDAMPPVEKECANDPTDKALD